MRRSKKRLDYAKITHETAQRPVNWRLFDSGHRHQSFTSEYLLQWYSEVKPLATHHQIPLYLVNNGKLTTHYLRMASITPHKNGWRAQIYVKGTRESKTFALKRQAQAWADARTAELRAGGQAGGGRTLAQALDRFATEVAPSRRGGEWEIVRIKAFEKHLPTLLRMDMLTPAIFAEWRDKRLTEVKASSVLRETALLNTILETARREWGWIESNPLKDVKMPGAPRHRERIVTGHELRAVLRWLRFGKAIGTDTQAVGACALLALFTGMRSGELTTLEWSQVNKDHIKLDKTKTDEPRNVPLTHGAAALLERLRGRHPTSVLDLDPRTRDALFRRARRASGGAGFTFHDLRHTAATRFANSGRVSVLELCKIMGWRDPKFALVYFNPTISDLAAKMR